jgi:hypothetical protein
MYVPIKGDIKRGNSYRESGKENSWKRRNQGYIKYKEKSRAPGEGRRRERKGEEKSRAHENGDGENVRGRKKVEFMERGDGEIVRGGKSRAHEKGDGENVRVRKKVELKGDGENVRGRKKGTRWQQKWEQGLIGTRLLHP